MSSVRNWQATVFIVGWIAYGATYLLRKPLGVIKSDLETELSLSKPQLGWLDTALLLPYAIMQMLLSPTADKLGPRITLTLSLILSAASMASFGHWSNFSVFCILLFINGTAQSMCWPCSMKTLGEWFADSVRNTVFGAFGTCAFAGGVIGTALAVYLQASFGWRGTFMLPSIILVGAAVFVFLLFKQPAELGIQVPGKDDTFNIKKSQNSMSWLQLWKIPMVAEIAVAVFCLKVVRYCMYMWLPLYLLDSLKYTKVQAGLLSTVFEVGGVLGSATVGLFIDKLFQGRTTYGSMVCVALSTVALIAFSVTSHAGMALNIICMFLAGMFNCGPDTIIGGSLPAEIGDREGRNSAAAVVGLVNGFGSVGTFLEGPVIGFVTIHFGWSGMFLILIMLSVFGTLALYRASTIDKIHKTDLLSAVV